MHTEVRRRALDGLAAAAEASRPHLVVGQGSPSRRITGRWVNVYDHLDPVSGFDPVLANDFRRGGGTVVTDIREANWGRWRHSIGMYLCRPLLRGAIVELLEL